MKKIGLILLLLGSGLLAQAQADFTEKNATYSIKLHLKLSLDQLSGTFITLQGPYPAFQIQGAKGSIHHIEISRIGINNYSFMERRTRNYFLDAGYEFSFPLGLFDHNEDLSTYVGLGLSTSASSYYSDPTTPNQFIQQGSNYRAWFYLMPSVQRNVWERWFLEFAFLINLGELRYFNATTQDPSIPVNQQSFSQFDRDFFGFEQFAFRFGVGFRL